MISKVELPEEVFVWTPHGDLVVPAARDLALVAPTTDRRVDVRELGVRLFEAVFSGGLRQALGDAEARARAQARAGVRIVLRLPPERPELMALPWELMLDAVQGVPMASRRSTPVVREIYRSTRVSEVQMPRELTVLAVVAQVVGLPEVSAARELEAIRRSFSSAEILRGATPSALRRRLKEGPPVHVVHFIGHGTPEGLLLESEDARPAPVFGADELGGLLHGMTQAGPDAESHLRFVVLNACHGAAVGATGAFASLADGLVGQGVAAVVAMQWAIPDDIAVRFADTLYARLAGGDRLEAAVADARAGMGGGVHAACPALYLARTYGVPPGGEAAPTFLHLEPDVSLVGRDAEVTRVMECVGRERSLRAAGPMVCVVTGPPGAGKTALVTHAAHRLGDRFGFARLQLDLGGDFLASDPSRPLVEVLRLVGQPETPSNAGEQHRRLTETLRDRAVLLVLDNVTAARPVEYLLTALGPACAVIVTTQMSLDWRGDVRVLPLAPLGPAEATELFRRTGQLHSVDGADAGLVAQVTSACDGLPLALVVAGRQIAEQTVSLAELAAELGSRPLDLLPQVEAVFSVAYGRLEEAERRCYRALAAAPGSSASPETTATMLHVSVSRARRSLHVLVGRRLVQRTGDGRFQELELLRAHALQVSRTGEVPRRQRAAVVHLAAESARRMLAVDGLPSAARPSADLVLPGGMEPGESRGAFARRTAALDWFESEREPLLAAVQIAAARGWSDLAVQMAVSISPFLSRRSYWLDWQTVAERAAAVAQAAGIDDPELTLSLAHVRYSFGRKAEARALFQRAMTRFQEQDDALGQAAVCALLASLQASQDEPDLALETCARGLALVAAAAPDAGFPRSPVRVEGDLLATQGNVLRGTGRLEEAMGPADAARDRHRRAGDLRAAAQDDLLSANISQALGRAEEAQRLASRGVELARELDDVPLLAEGLRILSYAYGRQGRWAEAVLVCEEGVDLLRRRSADRWALAVERTALALAATGAGRGLDRGLPIVEETIGDFRDMGDGAGEAWGLQIRCRALAQGDRYVEAVEAGERALGLLEALDAPAGLADACLVLGHAHARRGHWGQAAARFRQAAELRTGLSAAARREALDLLAEAEGRLRAEGRGVDGLDVPL
ncbi:CHAT domain-containing protein [Geodermatophilus sp. SYSU D01062]